MKAIFHSSDLAGIGQLHIVTSKSFLLNRIHKSILLSPAMINMPLTDPEHQIKTYLQGRPETKTSNVTQGKLLLFSPLLLQIQGAFVWRTQKAEGEREED